MLASPAWAAKLITVQQLKELLGSLQQANKNDAEVAAALEQVELSEQLNPGAMNGLSGYIPGKDATEQLYVLQVRSAVLAPPAVDLPSIPAPDAAAQKAILEKATEYVSKSYAQLPHLIATKKTSRFQNLILQPTAAPAPSATGASPEALDPRLVIHYYGLSESQIESENGAQRLAQGADKVGDKSGQVSSLGQGPVLTSILQEAQAADSLKWLRWETVDGTRAAVFSFAVEKKKSHYAILDCCFTNSATANWSRSYGVFGAAAKVTPDRANSIQGYGGTSMQLPSETTPRDLTEWKIFKATEPYHGELIVDPATGVVLRMVTHTEFKPFDLVQREDERIDYGPVKVAGKTLILPVKSVVAIGSLLGINAGGGKYPTRSTLFNAEYTNYQAAGTGH
jgi:hypothetical protein